MWHGTSDYVVATANAAESRDQWTNVWGIGTTPTSTATLPGTSVENYDSGGRTVVRVYRVTGMGHGLPVDPGGAIDLIRGIANRRSIVVFIQFPRVSPCDASWVHHSWET